MNLLGGRTWRALVGGLARRMPYLRAVFREGDDLQAQGGEPDEASRGELPTLLWVPPGHYYSPIPSMEERERAAARFKEDVPREIPAIDLNEAGQLALLERFREYYPEQPFKAEKQPGVRYYFDNSGFSYADALTLYAMIRHVRPRRIIEVGSGFSSAVMLDTCERFLDGAVRMTFIEPYPERLLSLMTEADHGRVELIPHRLQDVDMARFAELAAGDILFIDSTHVAKAGSDVNTIFATILPALADGVYVHFHDIFYPFEYPPRWTREGRAWNELYMLRAFLQYNTRFRIQFFNSYLVRVHREKLVQAMPLYGKGPGGSIWLQKVRS